MPKKKNAALRKETQPRRKKRGESSLPKSKNPREKYIYKST